MDIDSLDDIAADHMSLAQLDQLERLIASHAASQRPQDLLEQRARLLARLRESPHVPSPGPTPFSPQASNRFGELGRINEALQYMASGWQVLDFSEALQGKQIAPGVPGTERAIVTRRLSRGSVTYQDGPVNHTDEELWWSTPWQTTALFPMTEEIGTWFYRFTVDVRMLPYSASGLSGSIRAAVTVFTGGQVSKLQQVGSYWPADVTLPLPLGPARYLGGKVPISGSIAVPAGRQAALSLIFVAIVSVAQGQVHFLETDSHFTTYWSSQMNVATTGRLECRFEPRTLSDSVSTVIDLAKKHYP